MNVAIVIVSFKCREYLLSCLSSIQTHVPELLEATVVADNASCDGTVEAVGAQFPPVRVIVNSRNEGFAAAANRGIAAAPSAEVIVLLNPDSEILDSGIRNAADYLSRHAETGVLGGRILNLNGTVQASARAFPGHLNALFNRHSLTTRFLPGNRWSRRYLMSDWDHQQLKPVDWVSGAFMFIHRRATDSAGLLDDRFFFSIEDVDYCRRVRDCGLEVIYFPGAVIRHRIGASSGRAVFRAMAAHHRGMWRYYTKHLRGNGALDVLTAFGIIARFALHAFSYAFRAARRRLTGSAKPR